MTSAIILVLNQDGKWMRCRVLLDSCATSNFISEKFAKSLEVPLKKMRRICRDVELHFARDKISYTCQA